jgi:hypothetical protein
MSCHPGYQMIQSMAGDFDLDVTKNGNLGGSVVWQTNDPVVACINFSPGGLGKR